MRDLGRWTHTLPRGDTDPLCRREEALWLRISYQRFSNAIQHATQDHSFDLLDSFRANCLPGAVRGALLCPEATVASKIKQAGGESNLKRLVIRTSNQVRTNSGRS